MKKETESRRGFIKAATLSAVGLMLTPRTSAASYMNIQGANSRVRVGIVGFADRSKASLIPAFMRHAKDLNFDLVAVSDIWNRRREEGAAFLADQRAKTGLPALDIVKARNNEELYARKDVDAVIIATADFQHALHGVEAVRAGCHAYIEKPLANTMADAKAILKAVEQTGKIVQIGTQRRSSGNYTRANEFIRSGKFGDIVMVEMSWNVNQPGRWRRPQLVNQIRKEDTDWNRFLMNRPKEDWDPRKYLEYRTFFPYSSGIPDQWMVHQIDTVHWFTGLEHPRAVVANGGIYQWNDGRRNADTMTAVFDYGKPGTTTGGFQVVYTARMTNSAGGIKELYYSNGGMLNLDTNKITSEGGLEEKYAAEMGRKPNLLGELSLVEETKKSQTRVETGANTGADPLTTAHVRNWMECVRTDNKQTNADVRAGYNHSVALCMTIAALHTGKRITFDDSEQQVITG